MRGFPKIRGTFLGVPMIRILVFCGLYWGPPILGNDHIITQTDMVDSTATAAMPPSP